MFGQKIKTKKKKRKEKCKRNSSSGVYLYRVDANFIICIIHSGKKLVENNIAKKGETQNFLKNFSEV